MTGELHSKMIHKQGMRNIIFLIQEIIDDESMMDVWVVYEPEKGLDRWMSLHSALWTINFNPGKVIKSYEI